MGGGGSVTYSLISHGLTPRFVVPISTSFSHSAMVNTFIEVES